MQVNDVVREAINQLADQQDNPEFLRLVVSRSLEMVVDNLANLVLDRLRQLRSRNQQESPAPTSSQDRPTSPPEPET
jgi:hypothetical protein